MVKMANLRTVLSSRILSLVVASSLVGLPLTPIASAAADDPAPCTPPPASTTFHYPNGADSATFTYNCQSGLWENAHFTFDPANSTRTAKDPIVYTCDPASGTYNFTAWFYSPAQGTFLTATQNVAQPPADATVVPCPPPPAPEKVSPSGTDTPLSASPTTITTPTSGGSNSTNTSVNNNTNLGNANNLTVANNLTSGANSGNAITLGNTTVGDTTSGNAAIVASEMNLLQTAANFGTSSGKPLTFVANINGNVNGDFLLDPATIASVQPASSNSNTSVNNNLTINNTTNATLNNTMNLNAASGNATSNENTTTGNIKSGNANAVANIVNTINSAVKAGNSFLGVININGNLNGDILLPPNFVNQLLAANVPTVKIVGPGTNSTNSNNTAVNNNTNITNTNNQGITNNVNANATSGTATANENTSVGNVGTGNANTNITAFNLTGSNVIGTNDLLVFVNVLGQWVGLIVNAPAGSTAAELGGGITAASGSNNTSNTTVNNNNNVRNNTNEQINNNVNVNARSGDATANKNTNVGSVRSGDAKAAVNLLNIQNSTLTLSNWFGILFINVFGSWNGSFGIDTAAGNPISNNSGGSDSTPATFAAFSFVPTPTTSDAPSHSFKVAPFSSDSSGNVSGSAQTDSVPPIEAALAATTTKAGKSVSQAVATPGHANWFLIATSSGLFLAYLVGERFYAIKKR